MLEVLGDHLDLLPHPCYCWSKIWKSFRTFRAEEWSWAEDLFSASCPPLKSKIMQITWSHNIRKLQRKDRKSVFSHPELTFLSLPHVFPSSILHILPLDPTMVIERKFSFICSSTSQVTGNSHSGMEGGGPGSPLWTALGDAGGTKSFWCPGCLQEAWCTNLHDWSPRKDCAHGAAWTYWPMKSSFHGIPINISGHSMESSG